ncbi:Thiamine-monophosphate kinase [Fundidesulfovibrio magnetotacticus]|uniref:Thiamine-monophosphate kinase n=1 Tax=Fundidesulfovibrio magnetotacticus TaxID=2730080 RepID=A0A6V8LPY2_9BACT|nr:thiamine-phosphate kinase [Fundidesulfovibrio magnetotacticus]GFK92408.1 Thiamine-monophosphate kinase [Fundidesulfovibrio magnetotacticus]
MNTTPFTSEDEFLEAIHARFPNEHPHLALGRGDDCALLKCPETVALTTDLFVEHVHFRRSYFSPADVGHKALAVNLSDLAAMGCLPLGFSLGLAGPPDTPRVFWEGVLDGMAALAARFDIPLAGGDLNAAGAVMLAVTAWGRPGPTGRALQRCMCKPQDVLFLAGDAGLARVGLEVLERFGPDAARDWPEATAAHLRPAPLVKDGLALAKLRTRGLMDLSDGLARDLPRFLGRDLGADLSIDPDILHPEVLAWAKATEQDPAALAVLGGEDYALLGACHRAQFLEIYGHVPSVWAVGEASARPGLRVNGKPQDAKGFDHFG